MKEHTIPVSQIGVCPVGGCRERFQLLERLASLEAKMWVIMAGVSAVIVELGWLLYRGTP